MKSDHKLRMLAVSVSVKNRTGFVSGAVLFSSASPHSSLASKLVFFVASLHMTDLSWMHVETPLERTKKAKQTMS